MPISSFSVEVSLFGKQSVLFGCPLLCRFPFVMVVHNLVIYSFFIKLVVKSKILFELLFLVAFVSNIESNRNQTENNDWNGNDNTHSEEGIFLRHFADSGLRMSVYAETHSRMLHIIYCQVATKERIAKHKMIYLLVWRVGIDSNATMWCALMNNIDKVILRSNAELPIICELKLYRCDSFQILCTLPWDHTTWFRINVGTHKICNVRINFNLFNKVFEISLRDINVWGAAV